jgi:hypothetical protein
MEGEKMWAKLRPGAVRTAMGFIRAGLLPSGGAAAVSTPDSDGGSDLWADLSGGRALPQWGRRADRASDHTLLATEWITWCGT